MLSRAALRYVLLLGASALGLLLAGCGGGSGARPAKVEMLAFLQSTDIGNLQIRLTDLMGTAQYTVVELDKSLLLGDVAPDGCTLLYTEIDRTDNNNRALVTRNLRTGARTVLRSETVIGGYGHPTYSPDGRSILFAGMRDLYIANADGTRLRQVASVGHGVDDFAWSPDGRSVVYSNYGDVWRVDVGSLQAVCLKTKASTGRNYLVKHVLPDGRIVCTYYYDVQPGTPSTPMTLLSPDGSQETDVTSDTTIYSLYPAINHDGTHVAYVGLDLAGNPHMFISDLTGSTVTTHTDLTGRQGNNCWRPIFVMVDPSALQR